jgi:DNA-binding NarL/FixJ family response regulator
MIGERTSWETLRSQLSTHQVVTVRLPTTEDADFAQAALDVGGLGYVVKARLASDLLPAIRAALADCRFISPTLRLFAGIPRDA